MSALGCVASSDRVRAAEILHWWGRSLNLASFTAQLSSCPARVNGHLHRIAAVCLQEKMGILL